MPLGLGTNLSRAGMVTPGIITDNLVLKHKYDAGAVVPVSDGAAYFGGAGTNNRIAITQISLSVHDAAFTFAFWAKRNTTGSVHHTILGRSTSSSYSHIRLSSDNYLKFESNTNTDSATITLNTVDTNWHHYVVIANSGVVTAYQDGVACSVSGNVDGDDLTLNEIGSADSGGGDADNEMDGYICNLAYWSAVLTQPQIKSIMWKNHAGLSDSEKTNLVSWWNLSTLIGGAVDWHGSNHGTLS